MNITLLPILILLAGIFLVATGYRAIRTKQLKKLPLYQRKTLTGDIAVKEGKKFLVIGVGIAVLGVVLLLIG